MHFILVENIYILVSIALNEKWIIFLKILLKPPRYGNNLFVTLFWDAFFDIKLIVKILKL